MNTQAADRRCTALLPCPKRMPARLTATAYVLLLTMVMAVIFVLDTFSDYEIAAAVFYTLVILAALRGFASRQIILLTAACVALTLLSFALTASGNYHNGLVNTVISLFAIAVSTWLGLRMRTAQQAAHTAQDELLRISRAANLGYLTATIAHEVGQPLTAISTSAHACQRWLNQQPPEWDKAQQALARLLADSQRASDILQRIRGMARGDAPQKQAFDLNEAVREMRQLCAGEFSRHAITLELHLAAKLPFAWFDRVQLQQILGNLLLNSVAAIHAAHQINPRSGKVRIRTQMEGDALLLSVADNGTGLSDAVRKHLFDAFWRDPSQPPTPMDTHHLGLGLTICRHIAEVHGAQLYAGESKSGAIFHLRLPASAQQPLAPA